MQGHRHVWPWLTEFSSIVLSCFTFSPLSIFPDALLIKLEDCSKLIKVEPTVQSNSLFSVMGQGTCEFSSFSSCSNHYNSIQLINTNGVTHGTEGRWVPTTVLVTQFGLAVRC